ncbi:MAG: hypothetical protein HC896_14385, partial [Bacteroidales bacterium]|nr:hypothetical protein [Bacteroidales bacterium]
VTLEANNVLIEGVSCTQITAYSGLNNITIRRCRIFSDITIYHDDYGKASNWLIYNNIVNTIYLNSYYSITQPANIQILNNIIEGLVSNFSTNTLVVSHNDFLQRTASPNYNYAFSGVYYALIANNIFYEKAPGYAYNSGFTNNLSYGINVSTSFAYDSSNARLGNFTAVNPQFTYVAGIYFDYSYDYRLLPSSPGKFAATDGTDIGIYGGPYPFEVGASPAVPQILEMQIQNPVLPQDGKLKVRIKARSQQ